MSSLKMANPLFHLDSSLFFLFCNFVSVKKHTLLALVFALALGLFLYIQFGVILMLFLPPLFLFIFNKYQK